MNRTLTLAMILAFSSTLAFADPVAPAGAPPPPPAPAPELKQLVKWLEGGWKCEASWNPSPLGPARKAKANATFKSDLGGYVLTNHYKEAKDKGSPMVWDVLEWYAYNPTLKRFSRTGVDNVGGVAIGWGAWEETKLVFEGETAMPMGKMPSKFTLTKAGDKQVDYNLQAQGPDGKWMDLGGGACKR